MPLAPISIFLFTENMLLAASPVEELNNFLWSHVLFFLLVGVGGYLTVRSRFFQVRRFFSCIKAFTSLFREKNGTSRGVHPLKVFFAAIGGCIGIGNVVGIVTAVQLGGPGALFWTWVGGLLGMILQYTEVYLGLRYRVANPQGGFDGGPMYFLPKAFRGKWAAYVVSFLLCLYGVEIFMFNVMTESFSLNWDLNPFLVVSLLLLAIFFVSLGGINRVGEICSALIPLFIVSYVVMCLFVLYQERAVLPLLAKEIFVGAFQPQVAKGAFLGSSVALAISMGLSRGSYSGDIGVGYTSVIYAESATPHKGKQSSLTILGVFLDTFVICSLSSLLVLATGHWNSGIESPLMVQESLSLYFPYMYFFMPIFLFLLGYTTILAYFVVGIKCAHFLSPKWGKKLYYLYAALSLPLFAFVDATQAFAIMSLSGAALVLLNVSGMFLLRKEVTYEIESNEPT